MTNMREVKISPIYYQMLSERSKNAGKNLVHYLADLIADDFGKGTKNGN